MLSCVDFPMRGPAMFIDVVGLISALPCTCTEYMSIIHTQRIHACSGCFGVTFCNAYLRVGQRSTACLAVSVPLHCGRCKSAALRVLDVCNCPSTPPTEAGFAHGPRALQYPATSSIQTHFFCLHVKHSMYEQTMDSQ